MTERILITLLLAALVAAPALAAGPLQPPCSGVNCSVCSALQYVQQIIDFIKNLAFILALVTFAAAAFLYMLGDARPREMPDPQTMMWASIRGIIVIAIAWTLVSVLLSMLTGQSLMDVLRGITLQC